MRPLTSFLLGVGLAGAVATLGLAQEKRKVSPAAAEALEAVELGTKGVQQKIAHGTGDAEEVASWYERQVRAARLTGDPAAIKAAQKTKVELLRRFEADMKRRREVGAAADMDVLVARFERACAEAELEQLE